jgi:hypothetical protein
MTTKPKLRSNIVDFIAANGDRITSFQLVGEENGRPVGISNIDFTNGKITRELSIKALSPRMDAVKRLAFKCLKASKPQVFKKSA